MLRTILFDDITDQRYQGLVFSTLRSLLRARLIAKMPWNYVDATNLSPHERRQWIKMAKSFGYEVQAVFFDVPLAVCMERNSKRDRQVTDDVMQKMAERLRPPTFKEGFDKITVVRVKGAPGTTPEASESARPPRTPSVLPPSAESPPPNRVPHPFRSLRRIGWGIERSSTAFRSPPGISSETSQLETQDPNSQP